MEDECRAKELDQRRNKVCNIILKENLQRSRLRLVLCRLWGSGVSAARKEDDWISCQGLIPLREG